MTTPIQSTNSSTERTIALSAAYTKDPLVLFCLAVVFFGFSYFLYWGSTAQLAQGVSANGIVVVEDHRRPVEHLEGGIVQSVKVRNGEWVKAGTIAITITDAVSDAQLRKVQTERLRLLADIDRLMALMDGRQELIFERVENAEEGTFITSALRELNVALFDDRRATHLGEMALVAARMSLLQAQIEAIDVRRLGKKREIDSLREESGIQAQAMERGLGNISRINELRRLLAISETELANLDEDEGVLERQIEEVKLEREQIALQFRSDLSSDLVSVAANLHEVEQELAALNDRELRRQVVVPVDGVVIDLAFTGPGAVIGAGERLFDIVPSDASLQIEARFQPADRDDLRNGRPVNLRFGTLNPINPPEVSGILASVDADATYDDQSGRYYYNAIISIPPAGLQSLSTFEITPGIPVEVFFAKDVVRTPLSYFVEPITEMVRLGMRS